MRLNELRQIIREEIMKEDTDKNKNAKIEQVAEKFKQGIIKHFNSIAQEMKEYDMTEQEVLKDYIGFLSHLLKTDIGNWHPN